MSSTPASPAPSNPNALSSILTILTVALNALATIPAVGADAAIAGAFIQIVQAGVQAFHAQAGLPIDLTKIPLEAPVA